jgi:hypothetical protein
MDKLQGDEIVFEFFLLPNTVHARPSASSANRSTELREEQGSKQAREEST